MKTTGPLLSLRTQGTFQDITFKRDKRVNIALQYSTHADAASTPQINQRAAFTAAVASWRSPLFGGDTLQAWKNVARFFPKKNTGYNAYITHQFWLKPLKPIRLSSLTS